MLPEKIGKYKIIDILGVGAMGKVYKAFDMKMGRFVAIKVMAEKYLSDEEVKKRFYKEAIAPAKLFHPNIVSIYDLDEEDGKPFIVMEFLDGVDLKKIKKIGINFSIPQIINILLQISRGLAHAHSAGIVHRDIKPANLILLKTGTVKIVDFGIAKLFESTVLTHTGMAIGTPAYMSPEQAKGKKVDIRTDQFSLGIVAYELISGKNPFLANNYTAIIYKILNETPSRLTYLVPNCPEELSDIVLKMLEKEIGNRFSNLFEVTKILEKLIQNYSESEIKLSELQTFFEKTQTPSTFSNQKIFEVRKLIKSSNFDSASEIISSIENEANPELLNELKKELEKSIFEKKLNEFISEIKGLIGDKKFDLAKKRVEEKISRLGELPILSKFLIEISEERKRYIEKEKIIPAIEKSNLLESHGKLNEALELLKKVLQLDESNIEVQKRIIRLERKIARIHSINNRINYINELISEREYPTAFRNVQELSGEFEGKLLSYALGKIKTFLLENFFSFVSKFLNENNYQSARKEVDLFFSESNKKFLTGDFIPGFKIEFIKLTDRFLRGMFNEENIYFAKFFVDKAISIFGEDEVLTVLKDDAIKLISKIEESIERGKTEEDELSNSVNVIRNLIKKEELDLALRKLNESANKFKGSKILEDLEIIINKKIKERENLQKVENLKRDFDLNVESGNFDAAQQLISQLSQHLTNEEILIYERKLSTYQEKFEREERYKNILKTARNLEKGGKISSALNLLEKGLKEFSESVEMKEFYNLLKREYDLEERNRQIEKFVHEINLYLKEENFKDADNILKELKKIAPTNSKTIEIEGFFLENRKNFVNKIKEIIKKLIDSRNFEDAETKLNYAISKCGESFFSDIKKLLDNEKSISGEAEKIEAFLKNKKFDIALMNAEILLKKNPISKGASNLYDRVVFERNRYIKKVLSDVKLDLNGENFSHAISTLKSALKYVPNSQELKEKLEEVERLRSEKIKTEGITEEEKKSLKIEFDGVLKNVNELKSNKNYLDALRTLENARSKYPVFTDEIEKRIVEIQRELERELETGRRVSKKALSLIVILLLVVISGIGYLILRPKPVAPIVKSHLILDFKPWAKVKKIENLKDKKNVILGDRITPFNIELKPGKYRIVYVYPSPWDKRREKTVNLKPGELKTLRDSPTDFEKKLNTTLDGIINLKNKK